MAKSKVPQVAPAEQTLNKQEAIFIKYRKQIIAAVIAAVVIIAGVIIYKNFISAPREDKASTALAKAQNISAGDRITVTGESGTETLEVVGI